MMQAPLPLMMLSFVDDSWCNAATYGQWFAQLEVAMATATGSDPRQRKPTFLHVVLSGNHDRAQTLFESLASEEVEDGRVLGFWRALF